MTRSLRDKPTYDVSTDGKRFLMVKQPANQVAPQIVLVLNWTEELKRLGTDEVRWRVVFNATGAAAVFTGFLRLYRHTLTTRTG
jgi:hypothetical protein